MGQTRTPSTIASTSMTVLRNDDGSHSPGYDPDWPATTQLAWTAAVAALETGLRIEVRESSSSRYSLSVRGEGSSVGNGPMSLEEAYGFLDGIRAACRALNG